MILSPLSKRALNPAPAAQSEWGVKLERDHDRSAIRPARKGQSGCLQRGRARDSPPPLMNAR
jgi:hypothetical protein